MHSYSSEYVADSILEADYGIGVLIKVDKTSEGKYNWANNEVGDETFLKVDDLCKVDIITESVTPIKFLFSESK